MSYFACSITAHLYGLNKNTSCYKMNRVFAPRLISSAIKHANLALKLDFFFIFRWH